jgi:hypothetical protein
MARSRRSGAPRRAAAAREPTLREEIDASGETPLDAARTAEKEAREDLQFIAREFLTWLVFHAEVEGGSFDGEGDVAPFTIAFGGRLALRSPAGMITDVTMKGPSPVGSADLRYALAGGLAVKEADLRLEQEDRAYTFGLAAEHFDLKRVKLPALLAEEDEARADERLQLLAALDGALRVAFDRFLGIRMRPAWTRQVVPAIRAWLEEGT